MAWSKHILVLFLLSIYQNPYSHALADTPSDVASDGICIACVSYNRLGLLQTTLRSIVSHLDSEEEHLKYSIAWVDNGSKDKDTLAAIAKEFPDIRRVWNKENQGLAAALNTAFFDLCVEPFILTLEEDWGYFFEEDHWYTDTGRKRHVFGARLTSQPISWAVAMLKHDKDAVVRKATGAVISPAKEIDRPILGVVLRPETFDQFLTNTEETLSLSLPTEPEKTVKAYRYCMNPSKGYAWGSYTNGPTLYNRTRLVDIGKFYGTEADVVPDAYSEGNYAFRAGRHYCLRVPQVREHCTDSTGCNAVFRHLGFDSSTNHSHKSKIDQKDGLKWLVYGTELYDFLKDKEL